MLEQIITWIIGILGAVGGISGITSVYFAKSNKQTIDIKNMQLMLDEAHKTCEMIKDERGEIFDEFKNYKEETHKHNEEVIVRFHNLEERLQKTEDEILDLKSTILQGYRCPLPDNVRQDCPVIKDFESKFKPCMIK